MWLSGRASKCTHRYQTVANYPTPIHPRLQWLAVQTQGIPVLNFKAAFLSAFIYHKESGWRGGKKCTVSDCVCFTVKPMLCLGRLANVKLLYNRPEYLTLLWGGLTLLLHNCLHCITPQSWMNSIMNFNSSTTLWLFTYVIFKHNAWTVKRKEKSSLCNLNHKHKLLVAKAIPTKKWGTSWASIIAVC